MSDSSTPSTPLPFDTGGGGKLPATTAGERAREARLEATFNFALEQEPGEREDFLETACRDDADLQRQVRRLLNAYELAGDSFEEFADPEMEADLARLRPEQPGDCIGPYRLVHQMGEGGFGVVWMAEQERPVKRTVALKIIKLGMDTREVIARFEQERQALAVMDHPGIAKVFDAGTTQYGRPYFAMELVQGIRITRYCDGCHATVAHRLELFMDVCRAVQHAHQKGVIHRDLKPSNILVTIQDGKAIPKVIDFGVAKAVSQKLIDDTIFTEVEQLIGTPLYMSPEQAERTGINVDTRTDIYALGVLLYELLTGTTPFSRDSLLGAGNDDIRRIIRETQPRVPSASLRALDSTKLLKVSSSRQVDPRRLINLVSGDLDWIVMKALEKERSRRYETANALLLDVERSIRGEPIRARPPSRLYRLGRMIKRHRLVCSASVAVLLALVAALVVATVSWDRERRLKDQADKSHRAALENQKLARHFLYAAEMNVVQDSLRVNNLRRARHLLDEHRPRPGEEDLRGWEWRYLWQQCRSKAKDTVIQHSARALSVTFSPDSKRIAACFGDGSVKMWELDGKKLVFETKADANLAVGTAGEGLLRFNVGGNKLILATWNGVLIMSVDFPSVRSFVELGSSPRGFAFLRDDRFLLCRLATNPNAQPLPHEFPPFALVDMVAGMEVSDSTSLSWQTERCEGDLELSNDSSRIFTSGREGRRLVIAAFDRQTKLAEHLFPIGEDDEIYAVDMSADDTLLAVSTGSERSSIQMWDPSSAKLVATLDGHTSYVSSLAFSPADDLLASASGDQTIRLWNSRTWKEHAVLRGHGAEIHSLAFSPDGSLLASGSKDGEILLWDSDAIYRSGSRFDFPADVLRAIPVRDAPYVLTLTASGRSGLWSLRELTEVDKNLLEPEKLLSASGRFRNEDRRWFAYPAANGARVIDKLANREIYVQGHLLSVNGVALSSDARRIATTSGCPEAAKIFDMKTGQELLNLAGRGMNLKDPWWTDDGNALVASSSVPGYAQAWIAPSWEQIAEEENSRGTWPRTQIPYRRGSSPSTIGSGTPRSPASKQDVESEKYQGANLSELASDLEQRLSAIEGAKAPLLPDDMRLAQYVGTLYAWNGRSREHFELSRRVLKLAGASDTGSLSRAARLYCLTPSTNPELMKQAVDLAGRALSLAKESTRPSGVPWHQLTFGIAQYRSGELEPAFDTLTEAQRGAQTARDQKPVIAIANLIQAMIQFDLGNHDEARLCFDIGVSKMSSVPKGNGDPEAEKLSMNALITWIYYREARVHIGEKPQPAVKGK